MDFNKIVKAFLKKFLNITPPNDFTNDNLVTLLSDPTISSQNICFANYVSQQRVLSIRDLCKDFWHCATNGQHLKSL